MHWMMAFGIWFGVAATAGAADLEFDWSNYSEGEVPGGWQNVGAASGEPGEWKVVFEEVAPQLAPLNAEAPAVSVHPVLAQLSRNPTDEHFPMFLYEEMECSDFTLTTRFKIVGGAFAQMAGVAFRVHDPDNYYVIRASALDNTLRFYKVIDGMRGPLIGPEIAFEKDTWYELRITCKGNQIQCWLDGKEAMPTLTDTSLFAGKIGFWTKSDTVAHFDKTEVTYREEKSLAQSLYEATREKFTELEGLELFGLDPGRGDVCLLAGDTESRWGIAAGKVEKHVLKEGVKYFEKDRGSVTVIVPVRDRNGDPIAAARITMDSFPGQTQNNALTRSLPIVRFMEGRIGTADTLVEN